MDDILSTFVSNLLGRLHGPFAFRFLLQPIMAMIYATRDGLADARAHRPPYFWSLLTRPERRGAGLREGWTAVTRVLVLGVVMDVFYQLIVFRWIHPVELVVVVLGLAFLPYVLMRGPIGRIASWWTTLRIHARPGVTGKIIGRERRRHDRTGRGRYA